LEAITAEDHVPRTNGLRRIASWVSIVIVVSSLAGWGLSNRFVGEKKTVNVFGGLSASDRPKVINTDGMTILAIATDDRSGLTRKQENALHVGHGNYGAARTDTIMLIRIAPGGGGATAVSMPRDSWISIPAYTGVDGKQHKATQDRINTLLERGGPQLMIKTLEQLSGLRIDHFVSVNFAGFLNMVDAVGGVPMCIPKALKDESAGLDLTAGNHTLTGRQALAYVRARHIDSDFGRMQRQQRFLSSMIQRVMSAGTLLNPLKLNGFIDASMSSITTDETLDRDAILNLALRFRSLKLSKIRFLTVPISDGNARINGNSVVLWNDHEAHKLFVRMSKDWPIVQEATTTTTTTTLTVAPGKIKVSVLNATATSGLARKAAESLAKIGFGFDGTPGNAASTGATKTIIEYPKSQAAAVQTLAASLPFATLTEKADATGITILVGSDWKAAGKVKVGSTTTSTKTSAVVKTITDPRTAADNICQ
jgi:LCP family protein required for cell wall assembly